MKKLLSILSVMFLMSSQTVLAKNIKVEAMSDFSTVKHPKTWQVKILETFSTKDGVIVNAGSIIDGRIDKVKNAKRLKRDATFVFVPEFYYDSELGYSKQIKKEFVGKYNKKTEMDAKNLAKKGAVTAGNILIGSFVAPTVGLVEGAVKNEKGNRAKSAVVSAYESTPLSYANKGKELEFKKGQIFIMSFKTRDDEELNNKPNYSYEMAD